MNTNITKTEEGKTVAVARLPQCLYRERLDTLVDNPSEARVVVVAKAGGIGDWVAYIGWPYLDELKEEFQKSEEYEYCCTRIHTAQQVLRYGDKLPRDVAEELFPEWASRSYRE